MNKSFTDIEQSKKLAKILPLESADMWHHGFFNPRRMCKIEYNPPAPYHSVTHQWDCPCWSLAALLNYLREIDFFPKIEVDKHSVTMNISYYNEDEGKLLKPVHEISTEAENFIDACYEMIIKLKEQNLL